MGFSTALSGVKAAATALDVIGNNVANANTVGYKKSNTHFADAYAATIFNTAPTTGQVGIGVGVGLVAQDFNQGGVNGTANPLDIAIEGQGFFRLQDNVTSQIFYGRNGQFRIDEEGYMVNDAGYRVTGYQAVSGTITGEVDQIYIDTSDLEPHSTANIALEINMPASTSVPTISGAFDPLDPDTYNYSTSLTAYDSLGVSHTFTTYFVQTTSGGTTPVDVDVYFTIDGETTSGSGTNPVSGGPITTLQFSDTGTLLSGSASGSVAMTSWNTGASGGTINFDFTGSTYWDNSPFAVNALDVDGNSAGRISGLSVNTDGTIFGRYTNGESRVLGQLVLANFTNPNGLQSMGSNMWAETFASGEPLVGEPASGQLGALNAGSVEASNVDLTEELVAMLISQRTFQANTQTIQTQDQILQAVLNIR